MVRSSDSPMSARTIVCPECGLEAREVLLAAPLRAAGPLSPICRPVQAIAASAASRRRSCGEDFSRIHDAEGIELMLYRAHRVDRAAELGNQKLLLADA